MKLSKSNSFRLTRWATIMVLTALATNVLVTRDAESQGESARVPEPLRALYGTVQKEFPNVTDMTVQELRSLQDMSDNWVLIDVRPLEERRVSMIPGAISLEEWEQRKSSGRSPIVIVYCTIGYRSAATTRSLRERGIDARNLAGGVLAWSHAGLEFVDGKTTTKRVHVYGRRWNILPTGYSGVW